MQRSFLVAAILAAALSFSAHAQHTHGNMKGKTQPGAVIQIYSPESGMRRDTTANEEGNYRFARLTPGMYEVNIQHPDGTEEQKIVTVPSAGATAHVK